MAFALRASRPFPVRFPSVSRPFRPFPVRLHPAPGNPPSVSRLFRLSRLFENVWKNLSFCSPSVSRPFPVRCVRFLSISRPFRPFPPLSSAAGAQEVAPCPGNIAKGGGAHGTPETAKVWPKGLR